MFSKCDKWIHLGYMLRLHSRCTPNVIGGYIEGKMIQYLQFTQDVPTGFQDTLPPVSEEGDQVFDNLMPGRSESLDWERGSVENELYD